MKQICPAALLIASDPQSQTASFSKKSSDKSLRLRSHSKSHGSRRDRIPLHILSSIQSRGLLTAMLSIPPRQHLDSDKRAEASTYRMTPLHITELALGLGLARRCGTGSTNAAINDTAVALVPRVRGVVVGKGIRGASVHLFQISITLYQDDALDEGSARRISRDCPSARAGIERGRRTRTCKVRRRHSLGRWEHPVQDCSRRRRLLWDMQSHHAKELRRKGISFAVFLKTGTRKTCPYYSQSPLCLGRNT